MRYLVILLLTIFYSAEPKPFLDKPVTLLFFIEQDKEIYDASIYGEPPQFAIWIENPSTGAIQTVFVTYRTGTGNFEGKSSVPVALPIWIGAFQEESGRKDLPTPQRPVDGISGATISAKKIIKKIAVPEGSDWIYYVEVNVAGDYTSHFPSYQENGIPDPHGNGQPSIIYQGKITAERGSQSIPVLIGRSEQMYPTTTINPDLQGIANAKKLFPKIKVTCK